MRLPRFGPARRHRPCRAIRRLARHDGGAIAVEFAMVGPVAILMILGIGEIGMVLLTTSRLDRAVADASRTIMTGQAAAWLQAGQAAASAQKPIDQFRQIVCANFARGTATIDCLQRLKADVTASSSLPAVPAPLLRNGLLDNTSSEFGFAKEAGQGGSYVTVRVGYTYTPWNPLIAPGLANMSSGERLIISTQVFRNEPF